MRIASISDRRAADGRRGAADRVVVTGRGAEVEEMRSAMPPDRARGPAVAFLRVIARRTQPGPIICRGGTLLAARENVIVMADRRITPRVRHVRSRRSINFARLFGNVRDCDSIAVNAPDNGHE